MKKLITTTAMLMLFTSITSAQETNRAYANCIAEASPIFGSAMTIENLRQYMKEHPTCATAPGKSVEYPAPSEPANYNCSVAVFGFKGCKDLERLSGDIESIRPCAEMANRGMQAQADRCFKETREFERDTRDRIRFNEGR